MEIIFYTAYADRRMIRLEDIRKDSFFTNFEEAHDYESNFFHDDDDWGVFGKIDDFWFRVWERREDGELLVSDVAGLKCGWIDSMPLSEYLKARRSIYVEAKVSY